MNERNWSSVNNDHRRLCAPGGLEYRNSSSSNNSQRTSGEMYESNHIMGDEDTVGPMIPRPGLDERDRYGIGRIHPHAHRLSNQTLRDSQSNHNDFDQHHDDNGRSMPVKSFDSSHGRFDHSHPIPIRGEPTPQVYPVRGGDFSFPVPIRGRSDDFDHGRNQNQQAHSSSNDDRVNSRGSPNKMNPRPGGALSPRPEYVPPQPLNQSSAPAPIPLAGPPHSSNSSPSTEYTPAAQQEFGVNRNEGPRIPPIPNPSYANDRNDMYERDRMYPPVATSSGHHQMGTEYGSIPGTHPGTVPPTAGGIEVPSPAPGRGPRISPPRRDDYNTSKPSTMGGPAPIPRPGAAPPYIPPTYSNFDSSRDDPCRNRPEVPTPARSVPDLSRRPMTTSSLAPPRPIPTTASAGMGPPPTGSPIGLGPPPAPMNPTTASTGMGPPHGVTGSPIGLGHPPAPMNPAVPSPIRTVMELPTGAVARGMPTIPGRDIGVQLRDTSLTPEHRKTKVLDGTKTDFSSTFGFSDPDHSHFEMPAPRNNMVHMTAQSLAHLVPTPIMHSSPNLSCPRNSYNAARVTEKFEPIPEHIQMDTHSSPVRAPHEPGPLPPPPVPARNSLSTITFNPIPVVDAFPPLPPPGATTTYVVQEPAPMTLLHQEPVLMSYPAPQGIQVQGEPVMAYDPNAGMMYAQQPIQLVQTQMNPPMMMQPMPQQQPGFPPPPMESPEPRIILEGWLKKRGPKYGMDWKLRHCILTEDGVLSYWQEKGENKKGEIEIRADSQIRFFKDPAATSEARVMAHKYPYGFEIFQGNDVRTWYLDPGTREKQMIWQRSLADCVIGARNRPPPMMQQHQQHQGGMGPGW